MLRTLIFSVALVASTLTIEAHAQYRAGLIGAAPAKRAGLERSWFSQVRLDTARGYVVGIAHHISASNATTIYEVHYENGKLAYSEHYFDRFGKPLGEAGAKKLAEQKSIQLQRAGLKPEIKVQQIPEITLYATTTQGMIHAIDGETGRTKWMAMVGNNHHPTLAPGANDRYVAVVNGSYIYLLDQKDGRQLWRRQIDRAPGAGPALSPERVFVPTIDGKLVSFDLRDYKEPVGVFQSIGRTLIQPIVTPRSVIWPTDRGHMNVGPADRKGINFRIEARDTITAKASFQAPFYVFMASIDGYVYSFHETSGGMNWDYSIGEPISQSPVPFGERLFLVTEK
ncbi:MAG: PQQ-binding-like beta-propeller repeat protein, partial [Pirellulaceae bacterium]|nr:PQQ-binding-like beta-propeller repeat protein [Pirellulaceae bacterium]